MLPERWQQIKNVLEAVLERPTSERAGCLAEYCAADRDLFREVESLLAFENAKENEIFENNQLFPVFTDQASEESSGFIGKKIGKYKILRELGAGGMGVVFLAERDDDDFEQKVAIKFLRHFFSASALQRFLLERKILARLHHRFIAQLIDGGTTAEGTPYLVMEYVEGTPITRYATEQKLSLNERLTLFGKVCSAVSFAHQNSIVHRDLKPDNILITEEGIPKLLDFGIAKLLSETEVRATVTEQQAYTPEYASPEQIKGETITTASDVYVLGIILYELLCGNRPFQYAETSNHKEIWHVANRSEPPKLSEAVNVFKNRVSKLKPHEENSNFKFQNPKSFKGDLDNIVLRALKREPERRYKSVEQLADDLRRYQTNLPVKARPDTVFYRASKFVSRQRWAIVAASLVVLSLFVGILATIQQMRRAERERLRAEQRTENLRKISKSLVFDVHDAIRNLSGSLPVRRILLERAIEQIQLLAQDAEDNPDLQDELAQAYFNVGEMQQAAGNIADSEESHHRALAIYEKLNLANPQNPNYLRGRARGYEFLANAAYLRGETDKSSELYAQAPPIFEQIAVDNPNDVRNFTDLWNAYFNYTISLIKIGRLETASVICQKALEIARRLNRIDDLAADTRQMLYQTEGLIAVISTETGDYQNSIVRFKEVISQAEKLNGEFPEDTRFQYDLWAFHRRLGIAYDRSGNFSEAISTLEKSRALIENLMENNSEDAGYKRNTSITLLALGQAFLNHREAKKALAFLFRARQLSETLLENDTDNGETTADLALIYGSLGVALTKIGNYDEALSVQQKALAYFKDCLTKSPENSELKHGYADVTRQMTETSDSLAKQRNSERINAYREKTNLLLLQSQQIGQR